MKNIFKSILVLSLVFVLAGCSGRSPKPMKLQSDNKINLTNEEKETFAKLIDYETGDNDEYTKRMFIDVILNRIDSKNFPDTFDGVLKQPQQFMLNFERLNGFDIDENNLKLIDEELDNRSNNDVLFYSIKNVKNTVFEQNYNKEYISTNYTFYGNNS